MNRVAIDLPGVSPFKLELHHRSDLHICPSLRRYKIWEPVVTAYLLDTVKPGQNAIDIGAHIGYFTLIMSKLVSDHGRVFAFEPEPSNFDLLQKNLRLNRTRNVVAERKAVSDRAGRAELHVSTRNTGDHRLYGSPALRAVHEVDTLTLDGYFAGDDRPVHFVKIDTQGLEFKILDGIGTLIERNRPWLALVIEFSPGLLRCSGCQVGDLLSRLERLKAKAFWLGEHPSGWGATPVTAHVLQVIAELMLRTKEEDYSRDIVLRFDR